jgi:hypothetical protein
MIIVRLLSPEPVGWIQHHQLYSGVGADIVMESISLIDQAVSDAYLQQSGQAPVFPLEITPIPADGLFWPRGRLPYNSIMSDCRL